MSQSRYVVGLSLAPLGEASALAVVEMRERLSYWDERDEQTAVEAALLTGARFYRSCRGEVRRRERLFDVVHLERLPAEASAKRNAAVVAARLRPGSPLHGAAVVANATRAGRADADELYAAGLSPVVVAIAESDVPGADLLALVGLLGAEHRLRVSAALPLAPVLAEELKAACLAFGPLASAVALACWRGERVLDPADWPLLQTD